MNSYSGRPKIANLLEPKRRVLWIFFKQSKILVRKLLN